MITELVNGMMLVATREFQDKVRRTINASPRAKLGARLGGNRDYYCNGVFATPKWFVVADKAVLDLSDGA
jgi:hypothetical protein